MEPLSRRSLAHIGNCPLVFVGPYPSCPTTPRLHQRSHLCEFLGRGVSLFSFFLYTADSAFLRDLRDVTDGGGSTAKTPARCQPIGTSGMRKIIEWCHVSADGVYGRSTYEIFAKMSSGRDGTHQAQAPGRRRSSSARARSAKQNIVATTPDRRARFLNRSRYRRPRQAVLPRGASRKIKSRCDRELLEDRQAHL